MLYAPGTTSVVGLRRLALISLGRRDEGRAALDESLSAGHSRHAAYEIALTMLALALAARDEAERRHLHAESQEILLRLGVHAVPALFGGLENASVM